MKKIFITTLSLSLLGCASHRAPTPSIDGATALKKFRAQPMYAMPFEFAPGELSATCDAVIEELKTRADAYVKNTRAGETDFDKGFLPFDQAFADYNDVVNRLEKLQDLSLDEKLRDEANLCEQKDQKLFNGLMGRQDLYDRLAKVKGKDEAQRRALKVYLDKFEENGLAIKDPKKRALLASKIQEHDDLQLKFEKAIRDDKAKLALSVAELEGVPLDSYKDFPRDPQGRVLIPVLEAPITKILEEAKLSATRLKLTIADQNRAVPENLETLKKILKLRQEIAELRGFRNYAELTLSQNRMAKNAKTVETFLESLRTKLRPGLKKDLAQLLAFKKELDPKATQLDAWDGYYLKTQLKKRNYQLDNNLIRPYFPAQTVMKGLFTVYSKILGITLKEKPGKYWAPEVQLFEVADSASGKTLGYFYTDLIYRQGKQNHAHVANPVFARLLPDGSYQKPMAVLVADFDPPPADKPSLLTHYQVETIFHEFGHVMHNLLTTVPYPLVAGARVAQDFAEAPSQMLENFVFEEEVLNLLSGHYQRPNEKLPKALLAKIKEARSFQQSRFYSGQLYLGMVDMAYNTRPGNFDTTQVANEIYKRVLTLDPIPNTHFEASFGHLMGYAAGYYGYLWSEVFADDIFERFKKEGLLNPKVGARYRRTILAQGSAKDPNELLKEFLGHAPSNKPFLKRLGIAGDRSLSSLQAPQN